MTLVGMPLILFLLLQNTARLPARLFLAIRDMYKKTTKLDKSEMTGRF
ncbi:hypothetical protein M8494_22235 [Serratia ureilytica]|nr:Hypothetical protein SMB2099_0864 [Serratia marcescens SMB2099]